MTGLSEHREGRASARPGGVSRRRRDRDRYRNRNRQKQSRAFTLIIATTFCDHSVVTKMRLKPCTAQPRPARDHLQHDGRILGLSPARAPLHVPCVPGARLPASFYTHHCDHWVSRAHCRALPARAPLHVPCAPGARLPARFYTHHCDHWVVAITSASLRLCVKKKLLTPKS